MQQANQANLERTVVSKIEMATGVYQLSIDDHVDFVPGQMIAVTSDKKLLARLYSICSAPNSKSLSIFFNEVEGGLLTPRLSQLQAGDTIFISKPFGKFLGTEGKAYWIATGTGIAPFLSMFLSGQKKNKILIQGSRKIREFWFQDVFGNKDSGLKENYIRCCTQEQADGVYSGRLTTYLKEQNALPKDYAYYLCGNAEMVVQVRDILIAKGIPYEQIISEIYF